MNIRNQDGVAMTEYALIIGLLVLVVVVVVTLFGERLGDYYTNFIDMFIELLNWEVLFFCKKVLSFD